MTLFTLPQQKFFHKNIVLVDLPYPYGKKKVYMNGSLMALAAQLRAAGHSVKTFDHNQDNPPGTEEYLVWEWAEVIGITVIGAPYIPSAIKFAERYSTARNMQKPDRPLKPLMIGGQVIANLDSRQFSKLFGDHPIQIGSDRHLRYVVSSSAPDGEMPSAFESPIRPVWEEMDTELLRQYLSKEITLVFSQGCTYQCVYCGAAKGQKEQFVSLKVFKTDMLFLARKAKEFGLTKLEAYASSLDFFQNPELVARYLEVLAQVQQEVSGVEFRIRCLSCVKSFLRAYRKIDNLGQLIRRAGLWCVGFGVDGADEAVWKSQHKTHNELSEVVLCLDICQQMGIRSEVLTVTGFAQDTFTSLCKNVRNSIRYVLRWKNTVMRPYLAKPFIPGNDDWATDSRVQRTTDNPSLFYNLDFCAVASPLTHPSRAHRWLSNAAYLAIIFLLRPFGRCATSPLLPQGQGGLYGKLAKLINRYMPFDR